MQPGLGNWRMTGDKRLLFPPFILDGVNQCLLRGGEKIFLRSKSLAVLSYLVEHPQLLLSKEELIEAVWPGAKVVDAALRVSIQEIRKALGDDATKPQFIETAGRNGYRFIAPISLKVAENSGGESSIPFVGRYTELEQLLTHLKLANSGRRQVVFVTGEPGIGKTALVDAFLSTLSTNQRIVAARGQCIEQYGAGEAYLSMIDALEQLCGGSNGAGTIDLVRRYAPSWLVDLPTVIEPAQRAELARFTLGTAPERRFRELATFFEALTQERTLVLVLEDLHWIAPSTLTLLAFLARRREAARLLLIGTYREGEVERLKHPLKGVKAELELHHYCKQLSLKPLNRAAVGDYLAARFENPRVSDKVLSTIYSRCEGNPLFMVNIIDYLTDRDGIVRRNNSIEPGTAIDTLATPSTIRQLIERQLEAIPAADQELLKVASVAGTIFSSTALAAGLGASIEEIEIRCDRLVKQEHFLQRETTSRWPDGTVAARYGFAHALYQNVIYESVIGSRKVRLHQSIGERIEAGHRGATQEVAAELALHFERAGDYQRAVAYLIQAAQKATQQSAYQEAIDYSTRGLQLLKSLPDNREWAEIELNLQLAISVSLASTRGYAAAEVSEAYNKANHLCQVIGDESLRVQALNGLFSFHCMRGEPRSALDFGKQMVLAAQTIKDANSRAEGHTCTGIALFYLGEFPEAQEQFDQAIAAYGLEDSAPKTANRPDYLAFLLTYSATNLWLMGYPARAAEKRDQALFMAKQLSHPLSIVITQIMLAGYHQCRCEASETLKLSDEGIKSASEYGFAHWLAAGTMAKGWALASLEQQDEGMSLLREGLKNWRAIGSKTETARFMALLVEAYLLASRDKEGLSLVNEALSLIEETEDRFYQSELTRLRGELLIRNKVRAARRSNQTEAESHFLQAIDIARRQKAKSFELRATISLARLWQKTGKEKEAKKLLAKIYGWFTEGFDTPDLQAAKELLDQLS